MKKPPSPKTSERELIYYTHAPCSLGIVMMAFTEKGICAVILNQSVEHLLDELEERFPSATFQAKTSAEHLKVILTLIDQDPTLKFDLPLDERGTPFQKAVWKACRSIPSGTTTSYTQLAKKVGSPEAVRAVGSACAANPLAILTPCHRVLKKDGKLSGYRWGEDLKTKRLAFEKTFDL